MRNPAVLAPLDASALDQHNFDSKLKFKDQKHNVLKGAVMNPTTVLDRIALNNGGIRKCHENVSSIVG